MNNQLTKELIRAWLMQRQEHPGLLPELEQIRRQVGWVSDNSKHVFRRSESNRTRPVTR